MARRYEYYFSSGENNILRTSAASEKIIFISSSCRVMFFLLYVGRLPCRDIIYFHFTCPRTKNVFHNLPFLHALVPNKKVPAPTACSFCEKSILIPTHFTFLKNNSAMLKLHQIVDLVHPSFLIYACVASRQMNFKLVFLNIKLKK